MALRMPALERRFVAPLEIFTFCICAPKEECEPLGATGLEGSAWSPKMSAIVQRPKMPPLAADAALRSR